MAFFTTFCLGLIIGNGYVPNSRLLRINVSPGIFLLAGVIILLIAGITIGLRTIKAATVNPVKSLRSE